VTPLDFPDRDTWASAVVHPDEPGFAAPKFYDYYRLKYEIAREAAPRSICEIGVRYGYSAWSFLRAAPWASYLGYDLQRGTHGGVKGADTFPRVAALLAREFPLAAVTLRRADTRRLDTLGGPYDFIHVDGDHSEAGCYHDLELAWAACAAGGTILTDDIDYIAGVKRAVERFCRDHGADPIAVSFVPSLRGECVIVKGGDA